MTYNGILPVPAVTPDLYSITATAFILNSIGISIKG